MPTDAAAFTSPRLTPWPHDVSFSSRSFAFLQACTDLIRFDIYRLLGFSLVRRVVAAVPVSQSTVTHDALTLVRVAVRDASIFYIKPVHCLQSAATVTRMLRRRGVAAEMLIGYQRIPLEFHAWVVVDGTIVWNNISTLPHYCVIDRL